MSKTEQELVKILLDKKSSISERDDAAMDLYKCNDEYITNALALIASDDKEDSMILNSCSESLGSIWVRKNIFDLQCYNKLSQTAKDGIIGVRK